METKTFTVPNISCGHCTQTIEMEVGDINGVSRVNANKDNKQVTVQWDSPATWTEIEALLKEINFPPESLIQIS